MPTYSTTQIANMALVRIAETRIGNLETDTGVGARECRAIYDVFRDEVMQGYAWPLAKKRAALTQLTETPAFGYDYAYQLPTDYLSAISLEDDNVVYVIEGDQLLTDAEEVNLHYIQREEDPTRYSPAFVKAFALRMAMSLAMSVAKSRQLYLEIFEEYEKFVLPWAKATDVVADNNPTEQPSSYVDAR